MKPIIALLLSIFVASASVLTNQPSVRLAWYYNTNGSPVGTNDSFTIYASTNLLIPKQPITNLTSIDALHGTNALGTNESGEVWFYCDLPIAAQSMFFTCDYSNFWGRSSQTSNLVFTPASPQTFNSLLSIQKLP